MRRTNLRPAAVLAAAVLVLVAIDPSTVAGATNDPSGRVPLARVDKHLTRDVYAFLHGHNVRWAVENADFRVLSTIAFFALQANPNGTLQRSRRGVVDPRWRAWTGRDMDRLIDRAHAAGTRIALTIQRFGWTSRGLAATTRLLADPHRRDRLARQIAHQVHERGVDGVNIDVEPVPSSQRTNFVRFVRQVRRALDRKRQRYDITVASTGWIANYDVAGLTAPGAADAMVIMAYHYRGSWSGTAGSIAPLTRPGYDVTDTVGEYLERTARGKIIMGVPYYGYAWSTRTSEVHSKTRRNVSTYGRPASVTVERAMGIAAETGRRWDRVEQGPWTRWRYRACRSCPVTWRQMYYEDRESLGRKYDLVNRERLRGVAIWALGYEGRMASLNAVLRDRFVRR